MKITILASLAALVTSPALADSPVHYCTGVPGGNYEFTGVAIKKQLPSTIPINTGGSLDNIAKVADGSCDAAIVQSDAYFVYTGSHPDVQLTVERARDMYPEYGHLICNKSISELSDLKRGNTVLVGSAGSGSSIMWEAIVKANPKYKDVATLPIGGIRGLGKVSDGIEAQCMLFVAGLKSQTMMSANEVAAASNGNLRLTYMRDKALLAMKDARGRPIYEDAEIPDGTYPDGLQKPGWISSGKAVTTIKVQSILIDNVAYANANPSGLEAFLKAVTKAVPEINNRVVAK